MSSRKHDDDEARRAAEAEANAGNPDADPNADRPPPQPDADADSRGINPDAPKPRRGPLSPPEASDEDDGAELDSLRSERDRLLKSLDTLRSEDDPAALRAEVEGLRRIASDHATRGTPGRGASGDIPGSGPVLWEGFLPADRTAPRLRFWGSENEAEAREQYETHAGITATEHKARVVQVGAAEGGGEVAPRKTKRGKKGK